MKKSGFMYLEPTISPRGVFDLDPRESHCSDLLRIGFRNDIASNDLLHIFVRGLYGMW